MKNKGIILFLILLAAVIVAVMVADWYSKRPDKMKPNKFEYSVDQFKEVPEELIQYKETKNFNIAFKSPKGITVENDKIYLVGDQKLKIIDLTGKLINEIELDDNPKTVEVAGDSIFVAFKNHIRVIDETGNLYNEWQLETENSMITALAIHGESVFVADAGTRKIIRFSKSGEKLNEIDGKANEDAAHGFIVPSPCFDIDINIEGDLWVVNPGLHALENYTDDGNLREHWKSSGINIEGFSGCCNPAHFTFLPDGSFVTAEKGMVRIKIYKPSGEFSGVVAPPKKFTDEGQAPDLAVDSSGKIYALDFDRKVLRVFEKK